MHCSRRAGLDRSQSRLAAARLFSADSSRNSRTISCSAAPRSFVRLLARPFLFRAAAVACAAGARGALASLFRRALALPRCANVWCALRARVRAIVGHARRRRERRVALGWQPGARALSGCWAERRIDHICQRLKTWSSVLCLRPNRPRRKSARGVQRSMQHGSCSGSTRGAARRAGKCNAALSRTRHAACTATLHGLRRAQHAAWVACCASSPPHRYLRM